MSAYPDGESAIDVRTFLHRIAKSARMFEHFDVGAEGAALARSVCDFVQRKRVEHVLADTELRDRMYANGREVWARMCATYDRLPADFPFRYVELDNEWLRLYVVFDGLTVIGDNVNKFGYYHLEAQDDAHRGWIGVRGNFGGRGACVPEGEVPIACALKEMIPGGMREFLNKMFILSTRGCRSSAILERYCREYGGFADVFPLIRVAVDEGEDTILFDDRAVCVRGSTPPADASVPAFFDPVRNDAAFWRGLFNRAFVAK